MQILKTDIELPEYANVLWNDYRHCGFYGGRGSAKSWSVARYLIIESLSKTLKIGCAREFQKNIAESSKEVLEEQIGLLGLSEHFETTQSEIRCVLTDSRFIFFGLWRNPDGIKSLEGLDIVWIEEASKISQRSIEILLPTVRRSGSKFIWTWNREYKHNPVERLFFGDGGAPPDSIVKKVGYEDNPWFPKELKTQLDHDYKTNAGRANHVWGGDYVQAIEGAYCAEVLTLARKQNRVGIVAPDPYFPIKAYWDLGHSDATAITVSQFAGDIIRVLNYCEGTNQPPSYYMNWLRSEGYEGIECVLPHDGASIHPENPISMSYERQLKNVGFGARVIPNQGKGAARQRIDVVLRLFSRIYFNEDTTIGLLEAIGHYHEKRDSQRNVGLGPEHDWSSHGFDSFGLMCIDYQAPKTQIKRGTLIAGRGTIA